MSTRIYIIGTGAISHHHAMAQQRIPDSELFGADPNPEQRAQFQKAFPHAALFETSDEMLAAPAGEDDIVVVATPPRWHVPEGIKALQSGRSVLLEKPLALNLAEAETLWETARSLGLHISTCGNRFQSWTLNRKLRELIQGGALGDVYLVDFIHRARSQRSGIEYQFGSWWFLNKTQSGGGPLMDWGPYDLNALVSILEPETVTVKDALCVHPRVPEPIPEGTVFDVETQAVATLTFEKASAPPIHIRFERTAASHGDDFTRVGMFGTEGHATWDWLPIVEDMKIEIRKTTGPGQSEVAQTVPAKAEDAPNWVFEPVLQFHAYLQGNPDAIGMFDAKALHAFRIIQAIYESAETQQPVTFTL